MKDMGHKAACQNISRQNIPCHELAAQSLCALYHDYSTCWTTCTPKTHYTHKYAQSLTNSCVSLSLSLSLSHTHTHTHSCKYAQSLTNSHVRACAHTLTQTHTHYSDKKTADNTPASNTTVIHPLSTTWPCDDSHSPCGINLIINWLPTTPERGVNDCMQCCL